MAEPQPLQFRVGSKTLQDLQKNLVKEPDAVYAHVVHQPSELNKRLKNLHQQDTADNIVQQRWYSYCTSISSDHSN